MFYIHFSEFKEYKTVIYQEGLKLRNNPLFIREKSDLKVENYYLGAPLPQVLVDAVNNVLIRYCEYNLPDPITMSFLISNLIYQGWKHMDEDWSDYYVIIVNGKPTVFKNTHPSFQELAAFDGEFAKCCYQLKWNEYDREHWFTLIENVLFHYLMGDIFEEFFNGNAKNLPLYIHFRLNDDVLTIYYQLYDIKSGINAPSIVPKR